MRVLYPLLALLLTAPLAIAAPIIPLAVDGATATSTVDALCVGCSISSETNVVASDLEAYATMSAVVGVTGTVSLRVTFPTDVEGGAKAGFRVGTGGVLDVGVLSGMTIRTYLNGVERASASGSTLLSLQLLGDDTGYALVRSKKSFDEVEIELGGLILADLDLRLYHAIALPKRNRVTITDVALASQGATVDSDAGGLVCIPIVAPCQVFDEANAISNDLNAAATISLPVGVNAWGWIEVTFPQTYDVRGKAGFVVRDAAGLLDAGLLQTTTVTTYLDDQVQEVATSGDVLRVSALGGTKKAVFLTTRHPFNRVRIQIGGLATAGVQFRVLYGAFQYTESAGLTDVAMPETTTALVTHDLLSAPAPNPTADLARLDVQVEEAQNVRVDVFDTRGRLVATPFDGFVEASALVPVSVDVSRLPAGLYVLRATGETAVATQRLTVAR